MRLTAAFPCTVRLARRGAAFTFIAGFAPLVAFMLDGDPHILRILAMSTLFMAGVSVAACAAMALMELDDVLLDWRRADAQRRAKRALWQAQLRRVR